MQKNINKHSIVKVVILFVVPLALSFSTFRITPIIAENAKINNEELLADPSVAGMIGWEAATYYYGTWFGGDDEGSGAGGPHTERQGTLIAEDAHIAMLDEKVLD